MRKLQQVALVVAAAGGLSAFNTGSSFADAPVAYNGAAPPPIGQPDAQAGSWTASQAAAQTHGAPAPYQHMAPQQPAEVSPQINPQLSPQLNPQLSPQSSPQSGSAQAAPASQNNLFRPNQECSPQSLLNANLPVAVLAASEANGVACTQANSQSNALANALHTS
ncbi:hypothetical protein SSP24_49030 [Streptomyces spinoverrucosus]|uniref:RdlA protein n=1 Tax=Streptomyces spinoverrucosus TaxID=284043 RepID=A0A4Y3VM51_9ACTN|nr:hypothetical protein [Streptomyces spinoverrucosus]GEC07248.1 hypothetical protein SSP24_49030 [Streptomyces spinoverrucosus]GHB90745.1 hypothetical protein GCM10010397_73700 [Streptomyces spinoverrucosus]